MLLALLGRRGGGRAAADSVQLARAIATAWDNSGAAAAPRCAAGGIGDDWMSRPRRMAPDAFAPGGGAAGWAPPPSWRRAASSKATAGGSSGSIRSGSSSCSIRSSSSSTSKRRRRRRRRSSSSSDSSSSSSDSSDGDSDSSGDGVSGSTSSGSSARAGSRAGSRAGAGAGGPAAPRARRPPQYPRGAAGLPAEQVAELRRGLEGAGMDRAVADNVLAKVQTSVLRRPEQVLRAWEALRARVGAAAANRAVRGSGANYLLAFCPRNLHARLDALAAALHLDDAALARLVSRAPSAVSVPSADLRGRIGRYALLAGAEGGREAAAWVARYPRVLSMPAADPEAILLRLGELFGRGRADVQRLVRRCHSLVMLAPAHLEANLAALADALGAGEGAARAAAARQPGVLTRSSGTVAEVLREMPRVLGVSAAGFRAAVLAQPSLLFTPLASARRRHDALVAMAARSPAWRAQWAQLAVTTRGTLLSYSDRRVARLGALLDAGLHGRVSIASALAASDSTFEQRVGRANGAAPAGAAAAPLEDAAAAAAAAAGAGTGERGPPPAKARRARRARP